MQYRGMGCGHDSPKSLKVSPINQNPPSRRVSSEAGSYAAIWKMAVIIIELEVIFSHHP
jgi:hypothetical protein